MISLLTAIAVSRDHKPDQTDERQRIEDAGGFVMWAGAVSHLAISHSSSYLPFFIFCLTIATMC